MPGKFTFLICLLLFCFPLVVLAQDATPVPNVSVPDLTGLSVPAAAALLNRSQLNLGAQSDEAWVEGSGLPQNTISAQSLAAGSSVPAGSAVDVTVLRSANMTLIYDDNDITLINRSGGVLTLAGVVFSTVESSSGASFNAARWTGALNAGDCGQLWSVGRTEPKAIEGCDALNWLTTNNSAEHFWTALNGVASFSVSQDGIQRAVCPAAEAGAAPITCDFFLAAAGAEEAVPYIYLAYSDQQLLILNRASDGWMVLEGVLFTYGTFTYNVGAASAWPTPPQFGQVNRLAPGQCLMYYVGAYQPPAQPCDVITSYDISFAGAQPFWLVGTVTVDGVTDDQLHVCPPATPGRLTICIMPR
ncbi:MAG: PASTA domain-containing protein [Chloroflexi bacterium]|nr:PASTA domain-containing protein [Chloroflexota bacterium]